MSQSNTTDLASNLGAARSLTWRYVIALSLVATLSTAEWMSLHLVISEQKSTAAVVNVSGRQRMLSQRTALFSNLLINTPRAERAPIRDKLKDTIDLMARSHRGLTHGDNEMGLPETMSPAVRSMYFDGPNALDKQVETYIKTVQVLLLLDDNALTPENPQLQYITKTATTTLVSTLDQVVRQYQLEGEASVGDLQKTVTIFWVVTLMLLMLEASLIFHPFVRHVRTIIDKLKRVTDELQLQQNSTAMFDPTLKMLQRVTDELQLQQGHLEGLVRQRTANLESRSKELAESEEKFHQISTSAQDAITIIGTDEQVIYWNPAAEKIFGYKANEVMGKNLHTLLTPAHYHEAAHSGFEHFRDSGEGNFIGKTFEITALRKSGEEFPIELSISAVRLKNSWHALGIIRDITERKLAEEELLRYKDHLEEEVQQRTADLMLARNAAEAANRAKSVFLSSMSHELRTPLNAILGFSNMMRQDPLLSQEQRENLDIINRSGKHLLTLINDVLEMAKIEAGRVQLESAPFDLGTLVRDVTDMMQLRAQEKGLQLLVDQSSEFPRYIKGDEARLRQVLINLVGNAVKFTRQGGVTVRFGMKPHADQQRLLIEVEDSGAGIKPEDLQKIFEPFVQLEQITAQNGTGLGLTITRQFVQLMGGTINVESAPGKGSTFRIELPVEKVAAADVVKLENVVRGDVVSLAPGQPEYRILIVEDQLENQLLLAKLMENVGFPVKVAENGEQAIQFFQSWQPHLIWMDRRMPVMDGLEATRRIRELPGGKEVKIVAVTASAFMEQRNEMLDAGMDDFVRKPYRFNEIYECLTKLLGVQYTYTDAQAAEEVGDVVLTAQMLAVLPEDLRRELHDAVESLEGERISAIIGQVASYDPMLHKTLSLLAGNFDYPAILKALQTNQPVNVT